MSACARSNPALVSTELAGPVDNQGVQDWIKGAQEQMDLLEAEDIASAIAFTVSAPKRMNLQQVTILPTAQPM